MATLKTNWPIIRTVGVDGILVSFSDTLTEPANRAALAFSHAVERETLEGVEERSTTLVSSYFRFDPAKIDAVALRRRLSELLKSEDWFAAPMPEGRKFWRIPTAYGGIYGPQIDEASELAGLDVEDAIREVSEARVRVTTIGFAPGQPYLGDLPRNWDIPRQTELTKKVAEGALTVAIRQIVLFSVSAPTGWRQIGQTGFKLFRPNEDEPFVLRPGDEVVFERIDAEAYENALQSGPEAGAVCEAIS